MRKQTQKAQDHANEAFHDAMRMFVGRGRKWSSKDISAATDIPERTIQSYQSGDAVPSLGNYQLICSVLGQTFFASTIKHLPFDVVTNEPGDISAPQLLTCMLSFSGMLSQCLEDGRLDHRERAKLKPAVSQMTEKLSLMSALLEASE